MIPSTSSSSSLGGGNVSSGRNSFEGAVDLRTVKEIRRGSKDSRDFAKWSEDVPTDWKKR